MNFQKWELFSGSPGIYILYIIMSLNKFLFIVLNHRVTIFHILYIIVSLNKFLFTVFNHPVIMFYRVSQKKLFDV